VLALLTDGLTNAEIADRLGLRSSTIKFHLRNLFTKLGVENRTEAATRFFRR
jgi:DNA-binding NarL/FixJ family response regulator